MSEYASALRLWSAHPSLISWYLSVLPAFYSDFPGCKLLIVQTYRSPVQQQMASAAGRSGFNGISSFSLHQRFPSDAVDLGAYDETGQYVSDGSDQRYSWLGDHIDSGLKWGGSFQTQADPDHVERVGVVAPGADSVAADFARYQNTVRASGYLIG